MPSEGLSDDTVPIFICPSYESSPDQCHDPLRPIYVKMIFRKMVQCCRMRKERTCFIRKAVVSRMLNDKAHDCSIEEIVYLLEYAQKGIMRDRRRNSHEEKVRNNRELGCLNYLKGWFIEI